MDAANEAIFISTMTCRIVMAVVVKGEVKVVVEVVSWYSAGTEYELFSNELVLILSWTQW